MANLGTNSSDINERKKHNGLGGWSKMTNCRESLKIGQEKKQIKQILSIKRKKISHLSPSSTQALSLYIKLL